MGAWTVLLSVGLTVVVSVAADAATKQTVAEKIVACDQTELLFAPYVWKRTGSGLHARAEATMPGAYLKCIITGTETIGLIIDGSVNQGCRPSSLPTIEYSIDEGVFQTATLQQNDTVYVIPLARGLDPRKSHDVEVYFRAADLSAQRWQASTAHLCIAGLELGVNAQLLPCPHRPRLAIAFGDSITEGVGVNGLFTLWQQLDVNNARTTWFPLVAAALDCEYGQLGSGGQGLVLTHDLPPLGKTWDRYDASTSRLTNGRLLPEPDFVFCAMGTNDPGQDIHDNYVSFLTAIREACPYAHILCVVPPLGVHDAEIAAAVETRHKSGDLPVHLIDLVALRCSFRPNHGATQVSYDGVHPSVFGQAMLGAMIAADAQRAIDAAKLGAK